MTLATLSKSAPDKQMQRDRTDDIWLATLAQFATASSGAIADERNLATAIRVADTIGCALGAIGSETVAVAHRYAALRQAAGGCGIWGTDIRSDVEGAALGNGVAARYLDFNDSYYGAETPHPSDVIPSLFGLAFDRERSGADLLDAVAVAYEVMMNVSDLVSFRQKGFDHVNVTMLGAATGAARLLQLPEAQARHAISIAVTSHCGLRQARHGELSAWKAFAAADACRHAVYAAALASLGAEGPTAPFVGEHGLFSRVLGLAQQDIPDLSFPAPGSAIRIATSALKRFPCGSVGQTAAQAAMDIVERGHRLSDIAALEMRLDPKAAELMLSAEKLDPQTRETADHSIPYVVVSTLKRGTLDLGTFEPESIFDEEVRAFLRNRLTVIREPAFRNIGNTAFPIRLTATLKNGESVTHDVRDAPGSPANQMSLSQVRDKFSRSVGSSPLADRTDDIWNGVFGLASGVCSISDLDRLLSLSGHAR